MQSILETNDLSEMLSLVTPLPRRRIQLPFSSLQNWGAAYRITLYDKLRSSVGCNTFPPWFRLCAQAPRSDVANMGMHWPARGHVILVNAADAMRDCAGCCGAV